MVLNFQLNWWSKSCPPRVSPQILQELDLPATLIEAVKPAWRCASESNKHKKEIILLHWKTKVVRYCKCDKNQFKAWCSQGSQLMTNLNTYCVWLWIPKPGLRQTFTPNYFTCFSWLCNEPRSIETKEWYSNLATNPVTATVDKTQISAASF